MKILLVCAGGMSTSILMKKMEKWAKDKNVELMIKATGIGEYAEIYQDYDIVLVGPQVSYKLEEIKTTTKLPTAAIQSYDYAIGNVENIMKVASKLFDEK